MARIEWVHSRLLNWARWKMSANAHGLGWATQAAFLRDPAGQEYGARIPIDEIEAGVTQEAVEELKVPRPQLYAVLQSMYIRDLGAAGTARALQCQPANVHACMGVVHKLLAAWFIERDRQQHVRQVQIAKAYRANRTCDNDGSS